MKTRLLMFGIILLLPMQLIYAQPIPELSPICETGTILKNNVCVNVIGPVCGSGTTYQDGICVVDETEKVFTETSEKWGGPTSDKKTFDMNDYDDVFTIIENPMKYITPYKITNATINDMYLNCNTASLDVSIKSNDGGILQLDIPHRMLSGIFMVLVDGVEWDDVSIIKNTLTVNFPENTSKIEILGSYYISPDKYTGVCDVAHDPPYSYILPPLKQIKNGMALIDVTCNEGKYSSYRYDRMRVACVSEETQNELWNRGWATMRLSMQVDNISHALCNNYEGKWHPKYFGCRDITDFQCSLMGGEFVDNLSICYDGICPEKLYSLCVTNPNLDIQYPDETEEKYHDRCRTSDTIRGPGPGPVECQSDLIECVSECGNDDIWHLFDEHGIEIDQSTAKMIVEQNEN